MARQRGARGRVRTQGSARLDETVLVPAGTVLRRVPGQGQVGEIVLRHDTIMSADCVGDDAVLLLESDWEIGSDAVGWAENG